MKVSRKSAKRTKTDTRLDPAALERYRKVKDVVEETRRLIATGDYRPPAPEIEDFTRREAEQIRLDLAQGRRSTKTLIGLERQIGTTRDILSIEFLEVGQLAARAVGRITIAGGLDCGTGVLVGANVLLTNNHVIDSPEKAEDAELDLDFEENRCGAPKQAQHYTLDPKRFFYTHVGLDFTFVAVHPSDGSAPPLAAFGWHPLIKEQGKIRFGDPVNIIHHPLGRTKSLTVHNSNFLYIDEDQKLDDYFWYSSDTEPGSSGAPVFNNRWEIVALHHCSIPKRTDDGTAYVAMDGSAPMTEKELSEHPERVVWIANEGIRASRIVEAIEAAEFNVRSHGAVRDELVSVWQRSNAGQIGRELFIPQVAEAPGAVPTLDVPIGKTRRSLRIEIDLG